MTDKNSQKKYVFVFLMLFFGLLGVWRLGGLSKATAQVTRQESGAGDLAPQSKKHPISTLEDHGSFDSVTGEEDEKEEGYGKTSDEIDFMTQMALFERNHIDRSEGALRAAVWATLALNWGEGNNQQKHLLLARTQALEALYLKNAYWANWLSVSLCLDTEKKYYGRCSSMDASRALLRSDLGNAMTALWSSNQDGSPLLSEDAKELLRNARRALGPKEILAPQIILPDKVLTYAYSLPGGREFLLKSGGGVPENALALILGETIQDTDFSLYFEACEKLDCLALGKSVAVMAQTADTLKLADMAWVFSCANKHKDTMDLCFSDYDELVGTRPSKAKELTYDIDTYRSFVTTWLQETGGYWETEPL